MKVRELLSDSSKWTQKAYSRNSEGQDLDGWNSQYACSFCLFGAIARCYPDPDGERKEVQSKVYHSLGSSIVRWNDSEERTFEDVKALVDRLDI